MFRRIGAVLFAAALTAGLTLAGPSAHAAGRTYFVSPHGSDRNPGTAALPFEHIQKCATVMVAGDSCQIASGTYHESVTPAHSGTSSAPIAYRAAPGAKVTIDGADPVTGWSPVSSSALASLESSDSFLAGSGFANGVTTGHIYQAKVTLNPNLAANQIFLNGAMQSEAQFPAPTSNNPLDSRLEWAQSGTTSTSLDDSILDQPAGFWVGAQLYESTWFDSETSTVSASAPGSVTIPAASDCVTMDSGTTSTHYYLTGKLEELSQPGEWFYTPSTHTLYLWTTHGDSPRNYSVEAKQRNLAIDLTSASYTTINNIGINSATIATGATSTGDVLNGIHAQYVSHYFNLNPDPTADISLGCENITTGETNSGLILAGTGNTVENSVIAYSAGNGIAVLGSGNTVTNNLIHDVDYMGSYAAGIQVTGTNQKITHNTVYSVGRMDIGADDHTTATTWSGNQISYNDLSDFSRLNVDDGAIYICCSIDAAGSSIDHNWLHGSSVQGLDLLTPFAQAGVYLDNSTFDVTAYDNVGWGVPDGTVLVNGNGSSVGGFHIFNNDGIGNPAFNGGPSFTSSQVVNNLGSISGSAPGATSSNNLTSGDPLYRAPSDQDFTLQANSPARDAGIVEAPATDGYTDANPSIGAYQYGAPRWVAGASISNLYPSTPIQAENYTAGHGTKITSGGSGHVTNLGYGDWLEYQNVSFGHFGLDEFSASVSVDPAYAGRKVAIRVDGANGPTIGTLTLTSTGSRTTYQTQTSKLAPIQGTHNLFLVPLPGRGQFGQSDQFRLDFFQLLQSARTTIQAEDFSAQSGTYVDQNGGDIAPGVKGYGVNGIDSGDWLEYNNVDFGSSSPGTFTASVAVDPANAGKQLAIHLDSLTGPVIGTLTLTSTGSFTTFASESTPLTSPATGRHDVYLVPVGSGQTGYCNLDYFKFS